MLLLRAAPLKQPELGELHDRLVQAQVWLGNLREAASAAERKLETCPLLTPTDFLRSASIRAQLGETEKAVALARRGLAVFPQFPRLLTVLSELETSHDADLESPLLSGAKKAL